MKLVTLSLVMLCLLVGRPVNLFARSNDTLKTCRPWPELVQMQFAGNIGFVSAGVGYGLLKDNLRLMIIYGYVPAVFTHSTAVHLFTLKSTVRLFELQTRSLSFAPYVGVAGTLEPGRHSFAVLPDVYPKNYYGTTAFQVTGIGGLSVALPVKNKIINSVELYGECIAAGTMLGYRWQNEEVGWNRIFSAAFGLVVEL